MDKSSLKLIAGPCSAETYEQVRLTASELSTIDLTAFRAGIWKPRTRPGSFEGVGDIGIEWLRLVKEEFNIPIITEVANPHHLECVLKAGLDMIWIGARTTSNPFSIQELAESLKGVQIPVFVKNPTNPDVSLWLGAVERFQKAGIKNISAVHRGFSIYDKRKYRNAPNWQIPIEFRRNLPEIPMFCDPSHISGRSENVFEVSQNAMDLKFDGLMIETHYNPKEAWTDAKQQLTPKELFHLIDKIKVRDRKEIDENEINEMRALMGLMDEQLIQLLSERKEISKKIGDFKKRNHIAILQANQWQETLKKNVLKAVAADLSSEFSNELFKLIHQESIDIQSRILRDNND